MRGATAATGAANGRRAIGGTAPKLARMEYRALGRSGLQVSVLTMGTMTFGGTGNFANVGNTDVDEARRQLDMCLAAGVNLIDTADVYSGGLSEQIVGEVLRGRRDKVLLATKVRMSMGSGPNDAGLSRHHIVSGCEASLRRLGTDHIDLYQVHEWDGVTPLEETLEALDLLVRSGKVRYVGASNYAGWQLMKALGTAERHGLPRFVSQQIYYSLQARDAEYELIPAAVDQGLGVLVWSPLAGGLLSGRYRRDQQPSAGSRQLTEWGEPPVYDREKLYDTVDALIEIGQAHGVSAAQVALAYVLGRPAVTSLVIGARTGEQLADNLAAADLVLDAEERKRLDDVSAIPLLYPYWHQAKTARDRLSPADLTLLGQYL
ncbi:aldo/keto reductase [Rugosimonospora acidiphila]|uniref:Aldo/keto reductase n=2 Tax=Rugosimonospora acidiphila TaxID=556531 RepID=A0ABP9S7N2_9ACTN